MSATPETFAPFAGAVIETVGLTLSIGAAKAINGAAVAVINDKIVETDNALI
jgi:hypothetical protein